jgi:hypothetical protein
MSAVRKLTASGARLPVAADSHFADKEDLMTDPSPVFLLAVATFGLAIVLAGAQLFRVRKAKPKKLKEKAEEGLHQSR